MSMYNYIIIQTLYIYTYIDTYIRAYLPTYPT